MIIQLASGHILNLDNIASIGIQAQRRAINVRGDFGTIVCAVEDSDLSLLTAACMWSSTKSKEVALVAAPPPPVVEEEEEWEEPEPPVLDVQALMNLDLASLREMCTSLGIPYLSKDGKDRSSRRQLVTKLARHYREEQAVGVSS